MSDAASQGADAGIGTLRRTLSIANKRGLHARAAAKFVRTAGQFDSTSGLSIMGLMMLAAGIGSVIELACSGRQAVEAMAALSVLVESKFGED